MNKKVIGVRLYDGRYVETDGSEFPNLVYTHIEVFENELTANKFGYFKNDKKGWECHNHNRAYHTGLRLNLDNQQSPYLIGFEIEKEDEFKLYTYPAYILEKKTGWTKERDGSLGEFGYELVSPVFNLDTNFKREFKNPALIALINAKYTNKCGGHINVSCRECSPRDLFDKYMAWYPLLYALYPKRLKNHYSFAKKSDMYIDSDKYAAIYIKDYALEFRIFPAVRNVANLLWRIELIKMIVYNEYVSSDYVENAIKEGPLNELIKKSGRSETKVLNNYKKYTKKYN